MREGNLLQIAPPSEIYNRPADLFVAGFTGATNLLTGKVKERQGEFGTIEVSTGHRLTAWLPENVGTGSGVKITIRPEYVRRSEEHTSELQSLMRNSYAVFCLKKKIQYTHCSHKHTKTKKE